MSTHSNYTSNAHAYAHANESIAETMSSRPRMTHKSPSRRRPSGPSRPSPNRESSSSSNAATTRSSIDHHLQQQRARMLSSISRIKSIPSNPAAWYKLTICNPCRSECGYCHGDRAYVLTQDNPRTCTFPPGSVGASGPQVEILPVKDEDMPLAYRSATNSHSNSVRVNNYSQRSSSNYAHGHGNGHGHGYGQQTEITRDTSSDAYCVHFSNISPKAYLQLIYGGWRRSGKLLYLPKNWSSCCACFPIRLDTSPGVFKLSKKQKKILKRFSKCLASGRLSGNGKIDMDGIGISSGRGSGSGSGVEPSTPTASPSSKSTSSMTMTCSSKTKRQRRQNNDNGSSSSSSILNDKLQSFAKELLTGKANARTSCTLVPLLKEGVRAQVDHALSAAMAMAQNNTQLAQLKNDDQLLDKICAFHCTRTQVCKKQTSTSPITSTATTPTTSSSLDSNHNEISSSSSDHDTVVIVDVTLSCKVCPALCGKSKGCIDKLALGRNIIQSFQQDFCIAGYRWDDDEMDMAMDGAASNSTGHKRERCNASLKSLELHEKSAHINIHVVVELRGYDLLSGKIGTPTGTGSTIGNGGGVTVTTHEKLRSAIERGGDTATNRGGGEKKKVKKEEKDVFAEFIRNAEGLVLDADNESSSQQHHQQPQRLSPPYRLTVRNVPTQISGCMPQVHRLYCRYQTAIHNDEDPFKGPKSSRNPHHLDIRNNSSEWSEEEGMISDSDDQSGTPTKRDDDSRKRHKKLTGVEMAQIYPEYDSSQREKIFKSYNDFYRFLCATPLLNAEDMKTPEITTQTLPPSDETSPFQFKESDVNIPYGSYHQQYIINDKYLIAVGVVDILPHCLSSVYSFYDPTLSSILNLGKVTALYEIQWVKNARLLRPELKHYVLGYYIHSCQKMRYKAEYKPSELLCPSKGVWVDYEVAKKRIMERSPLRNCCDIASSDEDQLKLNANAERSYLIGENNGSSNAMRSSIGADENTNDFDSHRHNVDDIIFDIGQGPFMTLDMNMLSTEGKNIIRPILQTFVDEVGVEISRNCIVKLC